MQDNIPYETEFEDDGQMALIVPEYEAQIKDYYWINQSKEIINSQQDLSLMERRLIYSLVSLVQPDDEEFKTYTVQIKDLANLLGVVEKSFYERVKKTIDQLQSKQLVIENNSIKQKITWVQSATYVKGEGRVKIKLSEDLAPFFRNLKRAYTKYRIKNVLKLRSEYSWRLYEILKEREFRKERVIKIAELRYLLNIPDDKYKMLKHLRELLDSVQKELEEKTDITFSYDVHKRVGRSVESFIFQISRNGKNIQSEQDMANYDAENVFNLLVQNGVHRKKAISLAKLYHPFYIEENVRHALQLNKGQSILNLAGYIIKGIEDNYANSVHDMPLDDALFGMELRNVEENLADQTREELSQFKEIIENYKDLINRGVYSKVEELTDLAESRDQMLLQNLEVIQKNRKKTKRPPLLMEDLAHDPYLKKVYELWLEKQTDF